MSCYAYVVSDCLLTPKKTLFIDDNAENIAAAGKLGFQTHLIEPDDEVAEYLRLNGYY
jgi:HAD superfamily hydrolase (TIGR01509 family)